MPVNFDSGSGLVTPTPPAAIIRCGQDFETVSISGFAIVQIMCPEFNGTDATITAYKDDEVISLPVQFGPVPPPDDSICINNIFGVY